MVMYATITPLLLVLLLLLFTTIATADLQLHQAAVSRLPVRGDLAERHVLRAGRQPHRHLQGRGHVRPSVCLFSAYF